MSLYMAPVPRWWDRLRRHRALAKGWEGIGYLIENGFDVEDDGTMPGRRRDWTRPCDWGDVDAVLHRIFDDLPRPAHRQEDT